MWFIVVIMVNGWHVLLPDEQFNRQETCEAVGQEMVKQGPEEIKGTYCVWK